MASHYSDPTVLADRLGRLGYNDASKIFKEKLPHGKRARSGHIGEILATECAEYILPTFRVPIRKLRWLDGREMALRGEDIIGIDTIAEPPRFLKGESKSRARMSASVVAEARAALDANRGRPSPFAMGYVVDRLLANGETALAYTFESHMLLRRIPVGQMVHVNFGLCGNDASKDYSEDLKAYRQRIEQHTIMFRVDGHPSLIKSAYENLKKYAPKR